MKPQQHSVEGLEIPANVERFLQDQDSSLDDRKGRNKRCRSERDDLPFEFEKGLTFLQGLTKLEIDGDEIPFENLSDQFDIGHSIGEGGSAEVFVAVDSAGQKVALKLLRTNLAVSKSEVIREARRIHPIRHPNFVRLLRIGTFKGRFALVYELIEGVSLADVMRKGSVDARLSVEIVANLAEGLHHVHQQHGLIHRDIKPENIRLAGAASVSALGSFEDLGTPPLIPKLIDFGLSKAASMEHHGERSAHLLGTPNYMSLEQAKDPREADHLSDLYSFGVILFELLTDNRAFPNIASKTAISKKDATPYLSPRKYCRSIPRALDSIVARCTARSKAERFYTDSGELAADLRRYLAGKPIQATPFGLVERAVSWWRREPVIALSFATIFFLAVAAVLLLGGYVNSLQREIATRSAASDSHQFEAALSDAVLMEEDLLAGKSEIVLKNCERWFSQLELKQAKNATDLLLLALFEEVAGGASLRKGDLNMAAGFSRRSLAHIQNADQVWNQDGKWPAPLSTPRPGQLLFSSVMNTKAAIVVSTMDLVCIERWRDRDASLAERKKLLDSAEAALARLTVKDFLAPDDFADANRVLSIELEFIGEQKRAMEPLSRSIEALQQNASILGDYSQCELIHDLLRLSFLQAVNDPSPQGVKKAVASIKLAEAAARQFGLTNLWSLDSCMDPQSVASAVGQTYHDIAHVAFQKNDRDAGLAFLKEADRYLQKCRECASCLVRHAFVLTELAEAGEDNNDVQRFLRKSIEILRLDDDYMDPNDILAMSSVNGKQDAWADSTSEFRKSLSTLDQLPKHKRKIAIEIWSGFEKRHTLKEWIGQPGI